MQVPLPPGVPVSRFAAQKRVELPNGQVPLIDPNDPDSAKVQEHWDVKCRQFIMSDEKDCEELDKTFSLIAKGLGTYGESRDDYQTTWSESKQSYVVFLRWAEFRYIAPRG
jgi:hypothetical protein